MAAVDGSFMRVSWFLKFWVLTVVVRASWPVAVGRSWKSPGWRREEGANRGDSVKLACSAAYEAAGRA
jgi:hypothetical protein